MPPVDAGAVIVKLPRLLPATATTDGAPGATGVVVAMVCGGCVTPARSVLVTRSEMEAGTSVLAKAGGSS